MKHRVLIDVDGVLADCTGHLIEELNKQEGYACFHPSQVKQYDLAKCFGIPKKRIYDTMGKQGFCANMPVLGNAKEGMGVLQHLAEVFIVTSPVWSSPYWCDERTWWLYKHFGIKSNQIIFCSQKHVVAGSFFVDDRPEHVADWKKAWPNWTGIIWNAPHNQGAPGVRAKTWEDLIGVVQMETALIEMGRAERGNEDNAR